MRIHICTLLGASLLLGCVASTVPLSTRMNDAIVMGVKPSPMKAIAFEYTSNIQDGQIQPTAKDSREIDTAHPGYMHSENTSLQTMLADYLALKFTAIDSGTNAKIKVTLKDFWIEQYSPDSAGKKLLVAFAGGETNIILVAHLDLVYELTKNGTTTIKSVRVSADSAHVAGIGTGTDTSNLYRGSQSIEYRVADAVNAANNRAIVLLNQFIDTSQQ